MARQSRILWLKKLQAIGDFGPAAERRRESGLPEIWNPKRDAVTRTREELKKGCGRRLVRFKKKFSHRAREEAGGVLLTLTPEMLNIDVESENMAGPSDWSGRGSRSRGSSTMSTSRGGRFYELKSMIQFLSVAVKIQKLLVKLCGHSSCK